MNRVVARRTAQRRPAVTLLVAVLLAPSGWAAAADSSAASASPQGLRNEQEILRKRQKEYVREHSNPAGKVPTDAYLKGIEHVRKMKVAPYIGARHLGEATPVPPRSKAFSK